MFMPFGKFRGVPLSGCPVSYLEFVLKQRRLSRRLQEEIERVLGKTPTKRPERPQSPCVESIPIGTEIPF